MPTPEHKRRWYRLSPDRFLIGLLAVIGLLWLSDRFQWFGFNHHKGWTVLIAVAAVGVAALLMLLWWVASLIVGWRFQFGIRSVLVFCLASSIAVGWLAAEVERARRQAETVEWIKSVGRSVSYDWEFDADGIPLQGPVAPELVWPWAILGADFFPAVSAADFHDTEITDVGLMQLKDLTRLKILFLERTNITDAGVEHLEGLGQLEDLSLEGTQVTDAGLESLSRLSRLEWLGLSDTKVTDIGLGHLRGLVRLQYLILDGTEVTDAGLEYLEGSTRLLAVNLARTKITGAGLEHLRDLPELRGLVLTGSKITDAGRLAWLRTSGLVSLGSADAPDSGTDYYVLATSVSQWNEASAETFCVLPASVYESF